MSIAPEDLARQRFKPVERVFEKIARLGAELAETRGQVEQTEERAGSRRPP